jgi:hypothetical protein
MSHAYRLSALKLVSDIELPELMPWDGRSDAPVELVFRLGKVPAHLEAPDYVASFLQTKGRNQYLGGWPDDARVLVENGSEVTVELAPGANLTEARAILMGPVQAVLWHQRGLLPLHASVVRVNGRALALAGPSGVGKSTLAAMLALKGHDVMADDICIIEAANGTEVLPSTPQLRLWRDALEHFGIAVDGLPRALARSEKYLIEGGEWGETEPRRLAAVVLLSRQASDSVTIERLRGARAIMELLGVVHRLPAARALGLEPAVFTGLTKLMAFDVAVWQLVMPDNRAYLDEAAAKVLTALDG